MSFDPETEPRDSTPETDYDDSWPEGHRSGYVAVVGAPNVGKSTLLNAVLGQKLAIISPKPQTTRHRMLGILTRPEAQIMFLDTPGLHHPRTRFGEYMVGAAKTALEDADLVLWVVDPTHDPNAGDASVAEALAEVPETPVALVVNKVDLIRGEALYERTDRYAALGPTVATRFAISALTGEGLTELMEWLVQSLPEGPRYYPKDQVTDREERFLAAELIREQALRALRQEVPHAVAVAVEEFVERPNGNVYIAATIYIERESQKAIVIGAGGKTLKKISTEARQEIERLVGASVYLELWVKVKPDWRRSDSQLRDLGFRTPPRG